MKNKIYLSFTHGKTNTKKTFRKNIPFIYFVKDHNGFHSRILTNTTIIPLRLPPKTCKLTGVAIIRK